jgi:hypothetical protein
VLWSQPVLHVGKHGSCLEWDQGCKEGGRYNAPAVLKCEQLYSYADVHCHGGGLHRCQHPTPFALNGWPYSFILACHNTFLTLLWSLVAWIPPSAFFSCPTTQLPSAFWQTLV